MEDADRLARLETHAQHAQAQFTEIKCDIKELKAHVKESSEAMATLALSMEKGFAATNAAIAAHALTTDKAIAALELNTQKSLAETNAAIAALALRTEKSMRRVQIGFLMTAASLLAIVAHALHWL
jgi:hypothetical protein